VGDVGDFLLTDCPKKSTREWAVITHEAGRVVQQGSVEALTAQPATDFVAEFFHADFDPVGQGG
jgi:ABC-type methionine transport system ATPase subunit